MGLDMYLKSIPKVKDQEELESQLAKWESESYEEWKQHFNEEHYWRKFNALHIWLVDNVQGGEDECNPYIVTKEHLLTLQEVLDTITASNELAEELFPTGSGFFFGSTDYDDWYWENVQETKQWLSDFIYNFNFDTRTLFYRSSW